MPKQSKTLAAMTICGGLFLAGCSSKDDNNISGIHAVSSADAAKLNSERSSQFESTQDPPITANTHFAAGQLAESQDNPALAVKQYEEALKLDPNHLGALYRLGVVYTGLTRYDDAIAIWKRYVKASGESADAYSNLAFCQEMAGHPEVAEGSYLQGIARSPKNVPCRVNYGLMLARHGRTEEAVRQWQTVLSEAEVHYNLASVYELQNRREQARAEYQQALQLNPRFADAKARLAALDQN
jgi:tetratricopeptide (TPR) repeat protein